MRRLATANRHQCIELFLVHVLPVDGTQCKLGTRRTQWHLKSESLPLIPQCGVHRFFYWHSNETWVWLAKFSFIQCSSETESPLQRLFYTFHSCWFTLPLNCRLTAKLNVLHIITLDIILKKCLKNLKCHSNFEDKLGKHSVPSNYC